MPFGSRRFFGSNIRPGATALPADITVSNTSFETTSKFGTHSIQANMGTPLPNSQNLITIYPKDRDFFLNSDHAWTIEWWVRTTDDDLNISGLDPLLANLSLTSMSTNNPSFPRFTLVDPGINDAWRCIGVSGFEDGRRVLNAAEWVHFAIVSTGTDSTTGNLKWFINGFEQFPEVQYTRNWNNYDQRRNFNFGFFKSEGVISNFSGGIYWDEIRISNTQRYTSDFTPSTSAFVSDENTLALFHFDNNLIDSSAEGL
jgi:hypothetical protein